MSIVLLEYPNKMLIPKEFRLCGLGIEFDILHGEGDIGTVPKVEIFFHDSLFQKLQYFLIVLLIFRVLIIYHRSERQVNNTFNLIYFVALGIWESH